jgi:hypothetical protein
LISEPALTGVNVLVSVDGVRDTTLVREAFAASHLFCRSEKCDNPPFVGVVSAIIFFQRNKLTCKPERERNCGPDESQGFDVCE